jgi:nicotinamide riboside transporter PnuC
MDTLKKIFPRAFKTDSVGSLVVNILVFVVIGVLAGLVISLTGLITVWLPGIGLIIAWLLGIVSTIVDIYVVAAIILSILAFLKIVK